jgi:uncharacterized protein (TIGR03067 family)
MVRVFAAVACLPLLMSAARADDPKADADAHIGTWRMVAVVVDGKDTPVGPSTLMAVTREGWTVTADGKPYAKGTTKADRAKSPVQSEVHYAEGALAGKTLQQISRIDGDIMYACAGATRPTEFKSTAGSGHTLSVWIRVK